jgi:hypothetical protein
MGDEHALDDVAEEADVVMALPSIQVVEQSAEENSSLVEDESSWVIAIYLGTTIINFDPHFVFIQSLPNEERRGQPEGHHSKLYALPSPKREAPKFAVGVPFWIFTQNEILTEAPDGSEILAISGSAHDISVFEPSPDYPTPVIRCTFLGLSGKFIKCQPIETHKIVFSSEVVFSIFKDNQTITSKGDYMIKIRAGKATSRNHPHLISWTSDKSPHCG